MPELPDIQVVCERLNDRLSGKTIRDVSFHKTKRLKPSQEALSEGLKGKSIEHISRYGKALAVHLDSGFTMLVHFMLKGRVAIDGAVTKSTVMLIDLGEHTLQFFDPTSWTTIELISNYNKFSSPPDALDTQSFSSNYWTATLQLKSLQKIKSVLLDQDLILGIGNAYADEILAKANVHPASVCKALPELVQYKIYDVIGVVLTDAIIELRKIPDLDEVIDYRDFFDVHVKNRKVSRSGFSITNAKVDGKSTYFHENQTLYT